MGGYGSGRCAARPAVEDGLTINLPLMMRRGWIKDGSRRDYGSLTWSTNGTQRANINYSYDMTDPGSAFLRLKYTRTPYGKEQEAVDQLVRLTFTEPNYGGRRWWFICPYSGKRATKLYMPPGGDRFAGRAAWRLGYRSQRVAHRDRPFEKLFRLQRKLGGHEGWEAGLFRPKGMWQRTYEAHLDRYEVLQAQCDVEMMWMMSRLGM